MMHQPNLNPENSNPESIRNPSPLVLVPVQGSDNPFECKRHVKPRPWQYISLRHRLMSCITDPGRSAPFGLSYRGSCRAPTSVTSPGLTI